MFLERNKSNTGITLIALVVSIIVLLILARYKYFYVKPEITEFYREPQMLK